MAVPFLCISFKKIGKFLNQLTSLHKTVIVDLYCMYEIQRKVEEYNMITCQGKSVFSGVAIGKIFVYKKADNTVEKYQVEDAAAEFERFKAAQAKAITQLQIGRASCRERV